MRYRGVIQLEDGRYKALLSDRDLGDFDTDLEAALVRDLTARATFGELVLELNFPDLSEREALDLIPNFC